MLKLMEVKELPERLFPRRKSEYDETLQALRREKKGVWKVDLEGRNPKVVYQALQKRMKKLGIEDLKLHLRQRDLYIEKF